MAGSRSMKWPRQPVNSTISNFHQLEEFGWQSPITFTGFCVFGRPGNCDTHVTHFCVDFNWRSVCCSLFSSMKSSENKWTEIKLSHCICFTDERREKSVFYELEKKKVFFELQRKKECSLNFRRKKSVLLIFRGIKWPLSWTCFTVRRKRNLVCPLYLHRHRQWRT